jgi:hypothetical protein
MPLYQSTNKGSIVRSSKIRNNINGIVSHCGTASCTSETGKLFWKKLIPFLDPTRRRSPFCLTISSSIIFKHGTTTATMSQPNQKHIDYLSSILSEARKGNEGGTPQTQSNAQHEQANLTAAHLASLSTILATLKSTAHSPFPSATKSDLDINGNPPITGSHEPVFYQPPGTTSNTVAGVPYPVSNYVCDHCTSWRRCTRHADAPRHKTTISLCNRSHERMELIWALSDPENRLGTWRLVIAEKYARFDDAERERAVHQDPQGDDGCKPLEPGERVKELAKRVAEDYNDKQKDKAQWGREYKTRPKDWGGRDPSVPSAAARVRRKEEFACAEGDRVERELRLLVQAWELEREQQLQGIVKEKFDSAAINNVWRGNMKGLRERRGGEDRGRATEVTIDKKKVEVEGRKEGRVYINTKGMRSQGYNELVGKTTGPDVMKRKEEAKGVKKLTIKEAKHSQKKTKSHVPTFAERKTLEVMSVSVKKHTFRDEPMVALPPSVASTTRRIHSNTSKPKTPGSIAVTTSIVRKAANPQAIGTQNNTPQHHKPPAPTTKSTPISTKPSITETGLESKVPAPAPVPYKLAIDNAPATPAPNTPEPEKGIGEPIKLILKSKPALDKTTKRKSPPLSPLPPLKKPRHKSAEIIEDSDDDADYSLPAAPPLELLGQREGWELDTQVALEVVKVDGEALVEEVRKGEVVVERGTTMVRRTGSIDGVTEVEEESHSPPSSPSVSPEPSPEPDDGPATGVESSTSEVVNIPATESCAFAPATTEVVKYGSPPSIFPSPEHERIHTAQAEFSSPHDCSSIAPSPKPDQVSTLPSPTASASSSPLAVGNETTSVSMSHVTQKRKGPFADSDSEKEDGVIVKKLRMVRFAVDCEEAVEGIEGAEEDDHAEYVLSEVDANNGSDFDGGEVYEDYEKVEDAEKTADAGLEEHAENGAEEGKVGGEDEEDFDDLFND